MEAQARRFEKRVLVRFSHCDPAGIVFYPQYFVLFNGLIEDWVNERLGISYANLIHVAKVGLPTVSLACTFKAVSRMGDEVTLGLAVDQVGSRSVSLRLDCRGWDAQRQDDVSRVDVRNVLVTTDLVTHRAIPVPPDLRAAIERFAGGA